MPAHWTKEEAINNFKKYWSNKHYEEVLDMCNEEFNNSGFSSINDLESFDKDQLIQWFLNLNSWNEEIQRWEK